MFKNIVIVDDSYYKRKAILEASRGLCPDAKIDAFRYGNEFLSFVCREHLEEIKDSPNDWLLLLDMQLPMSMHNRIEIDGGCQILDNLSTCQLESPVVVISSEGVDDNQAKETYEHFVGSIITRPYAYRIYEMMKGMLRDYIDD